MFRRAHGTGDRDLERVLVAVVRLKEQLSAEHARRIRGEGDGQDGRRSGRDRVHVERGREACGQQIRGRVEHGHLQIGQARVLYPVDLRHGCAGVGGAEVLHAEAVDQALPVLPRHDPDFRFAGNRVRRQRLREAQVRHHVGPVEALEPYGVGHRETVDAGVRQIDGHFVPGDPEVDGLIGTAGIGQVQPVRTAFDETRRHPVLIDRRDARRGRTVAQHGRGGRVPIEHAELGVRGPVRTRHVGHRNAVPAGRNALGRPTGHPLTHARARRTHVVEVAFAARPIPEARLAVAVVVVVQDPCAGRRVFDKFHAVVNHRAHAGRRERTRRIGHLAAAPAEVEEVAAVVGIDVADPLQRVDKQQVVVLAAHQVFEGTGSRIFLVRTDRHQGHRVAIDEVLDAGAVERAGDTVDHVLRIGFVERAGDIVDVDEAVLVPGRDVHVEDHARVGRVEREQRVGEAEVDRVAVAVARVDDVIVAGAEDAQLARFQTEGVLAAVAAVEYIAAEAVAEDVVVRIA